MMAFGPMEMGVPLMVARAPGERVEVPTRR